MTPRTAEPLALAMALTRRTEQLCAGLEAGVAELDALVTPVTAALLRWWFGGEACQRRHLNLHQGQRQAILNVIVAHEVLASPDLPDLYRQLCPDALATDGLRAEVAHARYAHPAYCLKMAPGTGRTWVLQALLLWQMLNATAALDAGIRDPRFTRRFLIVAPGPAVAERLLDALLGRARPAGDRDFATSETARCADVLVPPVYREQVRRFVQDTGRRGCDLAPPTRADGLLAVSTRRLPAAADDAIEALRSLPDLMVFNHETHRVHALERDAGPDARAWRAGLSRIAEGKGRGFVQVDISATPHCTRGGPGPSRIWLPHIVVDFELKTALRLGLVKALLLDSRADFGAPPVNLGAAHGAVGLSEAQRRMLRAGLRTLQRLQRDFAALDPHRHPKMLVVCEDPAVGPPAAQCLLDEGLHADDVLSVDAGTRAGPDARDAAPRRSIDLDRQPRPRVIVAAPPPSEGFGGVECICVIVALRSGGAPPPLELTIGHGLRPMWRDPAFADLTWENRDRIDRGEAPGSLIDVLSIVEHPRFASLYHPLMHEGLVGARDDDDRGPATGDLLHVGLRAGWQALDFVLPSIVSATDAATGAAGGGPRRLSEMPTLTLRESTSMAVSKCIYARQGWPARGGLARAFIEWCQADSGVEAFCRLSAHRHAFARLHCAHDDGSPAWHLPEFMVRTADAIYMVDTGSPPQTRHWDVPRRRRAARCCARINALAPDERSARTWHHALIGEALVHEWRRRNARMAELLAFARTTDTHADRQAAAC